MEILILASVNVKYFIVIIWVAFHREQGLLNLMTLYISFSGNFVFSSHFTSVACLPVKTGWNCNSLPDPSHPQLMPVLADLLQDQESSSNCRLVARAGSAIQLYGLTIISFCDIWQCCVFAELVRTEICCKMPIRAFNLETETNVHSLDWV